MRRAYILHIVKIEDNNNIGNEMMISYSLYYRCIYVVSTRDCLYVYNIGVYIAI